MNDYFANVGPNLAKKIHVTDTNGSINATKDTSKNTAGECENVFDFNVVTEDYVKDKLLSLSDDKATGIDDISCKLLKMGADEIVSPLTYIINLSLTKGIFPKKWKKARICPIFKGGDDSELCNYRPISILPILSKILERSVFDQLYPFLDSHSMLHDNQSGFRPKFSTSSALINITDEWLNAIDKGEFIGIVMLDLQKAFDTVDHKIF